MMATAEWKSAKLDELGFVGRGKSRHRPRNAAFLYGGRYPFFQTGDIKAANFHLTEYTQTYSEEGLAQSKLWKPGTLCITIAANIAETAILGIEGCFPDSVVGFVADPDKADVRFIKYYIDTLKLQMQSVSRGTTQDNLSLDKLLTFDFRVPPLPVQRRIAGILSAYDELMENSQRRIRILEAIARALYREWFVHFRFPGHEKVKMVRPPSRPGGASSKTDGEIPQGWKLGKLADVCRVIPGYAFRSSDWQSNGVPVVKIKNIQQNNTIETENTDFVSDAVFQATPSKFVLGHGDILIAMTGATAGKIGKLRIKDRFLLNQRVAKILPDDVFRSLVWCAISTGESKERFFRLADGAAQPNMSGAQIESVELICPPRGVVEGFSRLADPILKQTDTLYLKIQNLRRTRDLLLPRLLSGQVNLESKTS